MFNCILINNLNFTKQKKNSKKKKLFSHTHIDIPPDYNDMVKWGEKYDFFICFNCVILIPYLIYFKYGYGSWNIIAFRDSESSKLLCEKDWDWENNLSPSHCSYS